MDKKPFKALLGKQVVTKEGKKLGIVKDITFEARTGELIHIVVANPTTYCEKLELEKDKQGNMLIPFSAVIAMGDFMVIAEEDII